MENRMNNKEIIINFSKRLWENQDLSAIDDFFAKNVIIHSPFKQVQGCAEMKEIAQKWLQAFPDLLIKWHDFIAEGDTVVSRWIATGTHLGGVFTTSPTHREVQYSGVTTYRLINGKVEEYWALVDMHAILSQLLDYKSISEVVD